MAEGFSQLTEDVLYCVRNELLEDELGKSIYRIYEAGVCDADIAGIFESRVSKHKLKQAFGGYCPFKTPRLTEGDYVFGLDEEGRELHSRIQFLNAHSLMVAGSGAGKTTFSRFLILQIAVQIAGMFLFDLRKREFAILRPHLKRVGVDLTVLAGRNLKINPLQLPLGVTVSDWIPRVADMLIGVLQLPPRASKLLQAKLFPLYRKFENRKNEFPTLFDLFEAIKQDKDSNHQARIAILDSLEPVLLSLGPGVLAYRYGWPSDELALMRLVFELGGISEVDKNLILNFLVLSEFTSRIARGISNPMMDLLIFVDEAQRLCSASNQVSAIGDQIGLVRGTGIGVNFGVQSANGVLPAVISNTATKIMGRCGSFADYAAAGHSMGLTAEMIQWAQMNLKPGTFIGQLGEGDWRYPFVFKIPPMDLSKGANTDQTDTDASLSIPTVYASEFHNWGQVPEVNSPSAPATAPKDESPFDSQQEYSFCKAVVDHPMQPSSKYPKLAGISPRFGKSARTRLVANGFIREHAVDSGGKGRSLILLEALPDGVKAVQEYEEGQI